MQFHFYCNSFNMYILYIPFTYVQPNTTFLEMYILQETFLSSKNAFLYALSSAFGSQIKNCT